VQHHRPVCLQELISVDLGRGQDRPVAPPGCLPGLPEPPVVPDAGQEQRIGCLAEEPRQLGGVVPSIGFQQVGGGELQRGRLGDGEDRGVMGAVLVGQPPCRQMKQRIPVRDGKDSAEDPVAGVADRQRGEQKLSAPAGCLGEAANAGADPLPDRRDRVGLDG
jgi:hypothetical protein